MVFNPNNSVTRTTTTVYGQPANNTSHRTGADAAIQAAAQRTAQAGRNIFSSTEEVFITPATVTRTVTTYSDPTQEVLNRHESADRRTANRTGHFASSSGVFPTSNQSSTSRNVFSTTSSHSGNEQLNRDEAADRRRGH